MVEAIKTIGLVKNYGKVEALKGIDLSIDKGECYVLLGPNGAGKTTCIKILTGRLTPTKGKAYVYGYNVVTQKKRIKNLIAVMDQSPMIDPLLSVYRNIKFFCKLYKLRNYENEIHKIMEQMDLSRIKNKQTWFLSGGEIKRVQLARVLILRPAVMFLDEPTAGIDIVGRQIVWDILKEMKRQGITIFLSTHDLVEAEILGDRIGFLKEGIILKEGNLFDLQKEMRERVIEVKIGKGEESILTKKKLRECGKIKKINEKRDIIEVYVEKVDVKSVISYINSFSDNNIEEMNVRELNLSEIFTNIETKK